ncbi:MAG: toll/interleukin-1 receptor domain-containing protein, partial [Planctomycetaceae bacterium]|nr:toll/interleukin-1 receptor domain-containing protein [Planctomycetaceae bacterium]
MADPKSPSAFISYSHDSDDHVGRVLELADALRGRGINVILDQYVHPAPEEGWPRWMDRSLDEAQFVLMVCTETYRRRVMGREEPGKGHGVRWEGSLIYNRIYNLALTVYTRDDLPQGWARTQNNLGLALGALGKRLGGPEGQRRLNEAAEAYR